MDAITKAVDQCSKREALRAIEAAYALGVLAPPTSEMRQKVFAEFRSSEAKDVGSVAARSAAKIPSVGTLPNSLRR